MIKRVIEFNKTVIGITNRIPRALESEEAGWLARALSEEVEEFETAHKNGDFIGSIDAMFDTIYFAIGGLVRMGLSEKMIEEIFEAVHNCNMTKVRGVKEGREVQHDLDAVKPENWESPEVHIIRILEASNE